MAALTLAAVGDICFARGMDERVKNAGAMFPFEYIAPVLNSADIRFGTLESVMLPDGFPREKAPAAGLYHADHVWESLAAARFDIVNQATNHALDGGWRGLEHTWECIRRSGAQPIGTGPTSDEAHALRTIERNGLRVGFLGWVEQCNWLLHGGGGRIAYFDLPTALEQVRTARDAVDILVASLHAGLEYRPAPSVPRVENCHALVDAGADVVLCHHAHVPQGIELREGKLIAYGLGNCVFTLGGAQRGALPRTAYRDVLTVELDADGVTGWRRHHFRADPDEGRPLPATAEELQEAEAYHTRVDDYVNDPAQLREQWHASARHYLRDYWPRIVEAGPDAFVERFGWMFAGTSEAQHWIGGIIDASREVYESRANADPEYTRPGDSYIG